MTPRKSAMAPVRSPNSLRMAPRSSRASILLGSMSSSRSSSAAAWAALFVFHMVDCKIFVWSGVVGPDFNRPTKIQDRRVCAALRQKRKPRQVRASALSGSNWIRWLKSSSPRLVGPSKHAPLKISVSVGRLGMSSHCPRESCHGLLGIVQPDERRRRVPSECHAWWLSAMARSIRRSSPRWSLNAPNSTKGPA